MRRSAARHPWHQEYAVIGWIPTRVSFVFFQIRARSTAFHAAEHDWLFAADLPQTRSPVDFR